MRVLLLAALAGYAYGQTCADADGNAGNGLVPASCTAGSFYTGASVDATDITSSGDAGQTECCTTCTAGYATCTDATTGQTCDAGFGLAVAATPGECTACVVGTTFNAAVDDQICANVAAACTAGEFEATAAAADTNRVCTACDNSTAGAIATCDGAGTTDALTCGAGFGYDSGAKTCTACAGVQFSVGGTDACADRKTAVTGVDNTSVGKFVSAAGDASTDATLTDCQAGALTCTSATVSQSCYTNGFWLDTATCTACTAVDDNNNVPPTAVPANATGDGVLTCAAANATSQGWTANEGYFNDNGTVTACTALDVDTNVDGNPVPANATGDGVAICTAANASENKSFTANAGYWNDNGTITACTALAQSDIDLVVNVAATAGYTITCTNATDSVAATVTCLDTHVDTDADATNGCEADAPTTTAAPATTTTTAAPASSADDESAASPAFIAGTAIAAIALLL